MSTIEVQGGSALAIDSAYDSSTDFIVDAGGFLDIQAGGSVAGLLTIDGAVDGTHGGVVNLESGASLLGPIAFTAPGGMLNLWGQTSPLDVTADYGFFTLNGSQAALTGQGDVIMMRSGSGNAVTLGGNAGGDADVVFGSHASVTLLDNSIANVFGNNNVVAAGVQVALNLSGGGNIVQATDDTIHIGGRHARQANGVIGSGNTISLLGTTTLNVDGDSNSVSATSGAKVNISGANNAIHATNDWVAVGGTGADGNATVTGDYNRVNVATNSNVALVGDNNKIRIGEGSLISVNGSGDRLLGSGFAVSAVTGSNIWVGATGAAGATDLVSLIGGSVTIGAHANVRLIGSNDTVNVAAHANATLIGDNLNVSASHGANVKVGGYSPSAVADVLTGSNYTVTQVASSNVTLATRNAIAVMGDFALMTVQGSGNTITAGASDTIDVTGSGNTIVLGASGLFNDTGVGSIFEVSGAVGPTTFLNFGADPQAIFDLLNGAGGFATADDAYSALTSDGKGGVTLSLGSAGSLDFSGASASSLSAANFKIG